MAEGMSQNVRYRTEENVNKAEKSSANMQQKTALTTCHRCGAALDKEYELCPVCGCKLVDYCTFCGAQMLSTDIDCPECGMPSEGVICPDCNTLNFRSFCRKCNKPLSKAARRSVEKAMLDPKVREVADLFAKMADIESQLAAFDDTAEDTAEPKGPTESELRLRELMDKVGIKQAEKTAPAPTNAKPKVDRAALQAEYQRMLDEANKTLEEMLPPEGSTTQEKRNFCCARKEAIKLTYTKTVTEIKEWTNDVMVWICNECQIKHKSPEECYVREYGGKWVRDTITGWERVEKEVTIEKKTKVYKDVE